MTAIKNGKIVTPNEVIENSILLIENDRIQGISDNTGNAETIIDAGGSYVLPGLIDVHSDRLEQFIQPRPSSQMDFSFALKMCEREMISAGITTIFHSIALYNDDYFNVSPLRTKENTEKIADLIEESRSCARLIRNRVHLRIEIDNLEAFDIAKNVISQSKVHLISFMDHTPGQGQYSDLNVYYKNVLEMGAFKMENMTAQSLAEHHENKSMLSLEQLKELASFAREKKIATASHDDTVENFDVNREIGVSISEFPITMEAAKKAKEYGFSTVVGAPNILRGNSHCGNLSGAHAILEDAADIICSDYYPAAMLSSIFRMHTKQGVPLEQMVNRATLNPAKALGIQDDYGSIEQGKKADIIFVNTRENAPEITDVFVNGNRALSMQYWS
ncbi:MAG: phosphonate metabolism protein PhnM [Oscillospiraceae bacterium]|nr:phosphonate metabolism protein PhnM [Oscillospiraceae bacterium]